VTAHDPMRPADAEGGVRSQQHHCNPSALKRVQQRQHARP